MADVSSVAANITANSQAQLKEQVDIATLRKGLEMQEANMTQMLEALPTPTDPAAGAANPAENVGSLINTSA